MSVDPASVCLFIPPELKNFKLDLFMRIGNHIKQLGGTFVRGDYDKIKNLRPEVIPIIGCTPQFRSSVDEWKKTGRQWIYWDRGYARRVFATWLPRGADGGYYRWHLNEFQMTKVADVPADRWDALNVQAEVKPWNKNGKHIVVADTGFDYWDLCSDRNWVKRTVEYLKTVTDRPIVVRDKENHVNAERGQPISLVDALKDAHALVTHGSIAAVESVVMGCPVFVDKVSAAAPMGCTDFSRIEEPVYPERQQWLHSLAYHQFNEKELVDGTLWRLLR